MRSSGLAPAVLLVAAGLATVVPSTAERACGRLVRLSGRGTASPSRSRFAGRKAGSAAAAPGAFAIELVAACLDAGATPAAALAAAGAELPGAFGTALKAAADALAGGATTREALPEDGPLAPIAAVFRRSAQTGSRMSDQLIDVAAQMRADEHFERLAKAQRVGVLSALPLGLCMLPAFLLLAVVPALIGLGGGLLR